MKTNVINTKSSHSIDCHDGSLEIIGSHRDGVVFLLRGSAAEALRQSEPPFCLNPINTYEIGSRLHMLIFKYKIKSELRNPRKLLKSVRNKLVQAGIRNQMEEDEAFNKMYSIPDREEHRMFQKTTEAEEDWQRQVDYLSSALGM